MLEREYIQQRGFRNVSENGKVVGFQVAFRSSYYRGLWLSMLRPATLKVDGETFENDQLNWTIGGNTYEQKDFPKFDKVYWQRYEPAILTAKKPGGLTSGVHEVEFTYIYTVCYTAIENDLEPRTHKRKLALCR
jgi:hypothetical protein